MTQEILSRLIADGNPAQAKIHQKYHKSNIIFYGWRMPDLRRFGNEILKNISERINLLQLCEALWREEVFECRMLANFLLAKKIKWLNENDFIRFYHWFKLADGWALTDMLAIPVFGEYLIQFPEFHKKADSWKNNKRLWIRRAGILRFISPVRHKMGWPLAMESVLIYHMAEENFFIRKAIGWTLREWSKIDPPRVKSFTKKHKNHLSPLSYREATRNII